MTVTPDQSASKPTCRRFLGLRLWVWIAISIPVMFLLVLYIAVLNPDHDKRTAIEEIKRMGGSVTIEYTGPAWLEEWLKDQDLLIFHEITFVSLNGEDVTDEGLEHLKNLTALEGLYLSAAQITDAGLEHLKNLTALNRLDLSNTQITGAGLEHLNNLSTLEGLYLRGAQITDAGLEHLKNLTTDLR